MKKGFTFIETLVVIAIISSLSVFGMMKINAFQQEAKIDSVTNEILATLKLARSKSEQGEISTTLSETDIQNNINYRFPKYGVRKPIDGHEGYEIYIRYVQPPDISEEQFTLPDKFKINFESELIFDRLTGKTPDNHIFIYYDKNLVKTIHILPSGYFEIS